MSKYRFGIFEFDAAANELRREGVLVRLQAQPARVLTLLVEHAGEVVTRETLQQAVWGGETFVDFERGLNFCVAHLRSALGDSAESPRYIRTVPKKGYMFIAPIEPARAARRRLPMPAAIWIGAAIFVLLVAGWVFPRHKEAPRIAVARFDNETGRPELDSFATGLTDSVVAGLTRAGGDRYGVIGNAAVLLRSRSFRDLKTIQADLNANYVVIGQVQRVATGTRVLAHLIRMPEQTHLWVTHIESGDDPLPSEPQMAQRITAEISAHLNASPLRATN